MKQLITDASLARTARYGLVMTDGDWRYQETGRIPGRRPSASSYAEGKAVLIGLQRARHAGWKDFPAITDNQVVVKCVQGGQKNGLWHAIRRLLSQLQASLHWRPRQHVEAADRLIREARTLERVARAAFSQTPMAHLSARSE